MPRTAKPRKDYSTLSDEDRSSKVQKSLNQALGMLERAIEEAQADDVDYNRVTQLTRLVRADTLTADAIGRGYATEEVSE